MNVSSPRPEDVLARREDRAAARLRVAGPGKVVKYDASTQTADVQPMWLDFERDGEDDSKETFELPVLTAVPVCFPRGGGFFSSFPLAAGDGVLLVFADRDIGAWRDGGAVPADPGDDSLHDLGGAVAYPGLDTVARKLSGASADHAVIGKDGGAQIHMRAGDVRLGDDAATDFVALASLVTAQFTALKVAISGAAVVAGDGGASFKAALIAALSSWPTTLAATKVKAL